MATIVQKFGGTSVGSVEHINRVADIVKAKKLEGHDVVVVVSAMSGETDRLIRLANELCDAPNDREYSVLVSTGEQVSIALLAMALQQRGIDAASMTGEQASISTEDRPRKSRIVHIDPNPIAHKLQAGKVVVVAGFQGRSKQNEITTLGRGGSDTTAVALAAALNADECQIFTDVDGVYTADPRVVSDARRLDTVTFEEMLEMSSLGTKVLQIRAVEFAGKYKVPMRVLSTFEENSQGTLITYDEQGVGMESAVVSGVAFNRQEAKITVVDVPDEPGIAYRILGPVSEAGIEIDMIIQNVSEDKRTDLTFTVSREEYQRTIDLLNQTLSEVDAREVRGAKNIAKLSIVGVGMRSHSGIASQMFRILSDEGINIQMISTSEIKVSVVVDEKYTELGVRALHAGFGLSDKPREEFDPAIVTA